MLSSKSAKTHLSFAMNLDNQKIAIIGLGYVGLPLAVEFGKFRNVIGFDIKPERIAELQNGEDSTLEVETSELRAATHLQFTTDASALRECGVFIVTVPTPVDTANRPDLTPLQRASQTVGSVLTPGAVVIYESTVYPGATEEVCVPILEQESKLRYNIDFFCGYSPERINPGDKKHRLPMIKKITSGSTPEVGLAINELYARIITAGTHLASSIKVAEAAKVIENTQRDVNIALMNELSLIFSRLGIDTLEVLAAAGTKWNFLPFRPGLVGGHCIGVDPYYLTHKAQEVGYHPEVILAGRRINDSMGEHIATEVIKLMLRKGINILNSNILILGLTFKENCPDIRNTKVVDIIKALSSYKCNIDVYDPWVHPQEAKNEYAIDCLNVLPAKKYDAAILAVAHDDFKKLASERLQSVIKTPSVIYDVKGLFPATFVDGRL